MIEVLKGSMSSGPQWLSRGQCDQWRIVVFLPRDKNRRNEHVGPRR